jgi:hypothetical protein
MASNNSNNGLTSQPYFTVGFGKADFLCNGLDDTPSIQDALNKSASMPNGATVVIKDGNTFNLGSTLILPKKVSIMGCGYDTTVLRLKDNVNDDLIRTIGFAGDTYKANYGYAGCYRFSIKNIRLDGNDANQTDSLAFEENAKKALLKIYGYGYHLDDIYFEAGKENALYTEHSKEWNNTFNAYELGEAKFTNLQMDNYGNIGWVMRGPHDSFASNIKLKSKIRYPGDRVAKHGLMIEINATRDYGGHGFVGYDIHPWGDHTGEALYVKGELDKGVRNFVTIDGYIEGSQKAAVRLEAVKSRLDLIVGYCQEGVIIDGGENVIKIRGESNTQQSPYKLIKGSSGNTLAWQGGDSGPAIYDLTDSSNTINGVNACSSNTFIGTNYLGNYAKVFKNDVIPNRTNAIDFYHQAYPDSDSKHYKQIPYTGNFGISIPATGAVVIDALLKKQSSIYLTRNVVFDFINLVDGQTIEIELQQDATGTRTITFPTGTVNTALGVEWGGANTAPTWSTGAYKMDYVKLRYKESSKRLYAIELKLGFNT